MNTLMNIVLVLSVLIGMALFLNAFFKGKKMLQNLYHKKNH
jgi:hypothetical protein